MMRKNLNVKLIFMPALLFSYSLLMGQAVDTLWTRTLGGQGWNDQLFEVIATQDNHYIASGVLYDDINQGDIWLVKFNDNGDIIWNKTYVTDTSQPWLYEGPRGLMEKENGEIVVFAANSGYNHYILTIGADGNLLAKINYMNSVDPYYTYCAAIASGNEFIVGGDHAVAVGNEWVTHSWYRKIDAAGNLMWENSIPPVKGQDRFYCIHSIQSGGFILAGTSQMENNYDDILLCLITDQGDSLWTQRWGTATFDHPEEIMPLPGGGFIMAATKSYLNSYKGMLIKLDDEGHEQWMETYNDYDNDEIHSVKPTSDGGYIITGEYTPNNSDRPKFWIMKTNQQGSKVQSFHFGNEQDVLRGNCVLQTDDGGYIAVGKSQSYGLIVKVAPDFGLFGINESQEPGFELHPNPTSGVFSLKSLVFSQGSAVGGQRSAVIETVDLYGKVLETRTLEHRNTGTQEHWNTGTLELDISHFPAGIYFVRIYVDHQMIVKKIIKL